MPWHCWQPSGSAAARCSVSGAIACVWGALVGRCDTGPAATRVTCAWTALFPDHCCDVCLSTKQVQHTLPTKPPHGHTAACVLPKEIANHHAECAPARADCCCCCCYMLHVTGALNCMPDKSTPQQLNPWINISAQSRNNITNNVPCNALQWG